MNRHAVVQTPEFVNSNALMASIWMRGTGGGRQFSTEANATDLWPQ
jgi:hypothetical protein